MEKVVLELYVGEMGREPKKCELGAMLTDKQFTRRLDRRICERMDGVRGMGNVGTHGEPVQASDANRALDDVCMVLSWLHRRRGGAEMANGQPGGHGGLPVSNLPPQEHAGEGSGGVAVATDTARIELVIDADFNSFTPQEQKRLLRAIKETMSAGGDIRVIGKRRGSVRLTLEVTPAQAEQLRWAVQRGDYAAFGVVDAQLVAPEAEPESSPGLALSRWFRKLFRDRPDLLTKRSNDEVISLWEAANPGKEFSKKHRQAMANVKSALKKAGRRRKRRAQPAAGTLERLEEAIDRCLSTARGMEDRDPDIHKVVRNVRLARDELRSISRDN
jgi:hypothetical protein